MKIYSLMSIMLPAVLLVGCAGQIKELPDGRILTITTVDDGPDRSASYVQIHNKVGEDSDGKPILKEVAGDLTVGPTVAGRTIENLLPMAVMAGIQYKTAVRSAEIKTRALACPEGTANCNSTVIGVGGASAVSGSISESQSGVNADIAIQSGGCRDCAVNSLK